MSSFSKKCLLGFGCASIIGVVLAGSQLATSAEAQKASKVSKQAKAAKPAEPQKTDAQAIADSHMAQWKSKNPDRAENWVAEEKERHALQPPADNSDLLKGEQGESHTYGNYTEKDLLIWATETEKLVVEGSRIFHSAELLGGTVGVSCDMCHPHAANTHPETYPKYQPQMGRVALLRDMINWCIERPVRGTALEPDSPEMRALEAYIYAQRKGHELNYGKH